MRFLLDTHALIWALENNPKLSSKVIEIIKDSQNEIFVSNISFFEIVIKIKLNKLILPKSLLDTMTLTIMGGFQILPMNNRHIVEYQDIPLLENHKDPFDRMILAIASSEKMSIITKDEKFDSYKSIVDIVW